MRVLFWLLAVFAAAVALVILGRAGAGYVMFVYPPYRVELSLLFFAAASLAGFLLLYAALRLLGHAVSLPTYVRAYRSRRRRERAHAALAAALQAYYEGRYARAEKEAAAAFEAGPTPGLAALLAARAAHQMRDFERRDRWLERAEEAGEGLQAARLVSRAEFALEERDFAAARDALRDLHEAGPKHIATTRMLLRAERGAGAWDEVLRLATQLAKRDAISPALAEEYKVQANVELLRRSASDPGAFERRERWLPEHERDAQLLAVLGRLCAHAELWGKARSFLEASLSFEEGRGAHLDLARLAERLGQAAEAERHYRRAAELT